MKIFAVTIFILIAIAESVPLPTDPQIAGILISANSESVENAKIATEKSKNTEIKMYALKLINEHRAANRNTWELTLLFRFVPEENETTRTIKNSTQKTRFKLKRLIGAAFDKAYIQGEVELHQMMLDMIDQSLLPSAKNPELKWQLKNDRTLVEAQLEHAKQLQSNLK